MLTRLRSGCSQWWMFTTSDEVYNHLFSNDLPISPHCIPALHQLIWGFVYNVRNVIVKGGSKLWHYGYLGAIDGVSLTTHMNHGLSLYSLKTLKTPVKADALNKRRDNQQVWGGQGSDIGFTLKMKGAIRRSRRRRSMKERVETIGGLAGKQSRDEKCVWWRRPTRKCLNAGRVGKECMKSQHLWEGGL